LFGIGKRVVFKVLKDSPENFRDLSILADCDTDKSIDAARKLAIIPVYVALKESNGCIESRHLYQAS
jgi:hypothetical protein